MKNLAICFRECQKYRRFPSESPILYTYVNHLLVTLLALAAHLTVNSNLLLLLLECLLVALLEA